MSAGPAPPAARRMRASVVVPVYYNAETLPELVRRLQEVAARLADVDFEFLFVDDGSRDGSFECLARASASDPRVKALRLSRNFGSNVAILAGLGRAQGDAISVISADLQDPPELIPDMIERFKAGAEAVLAARAKRSDPLLTRLFAAVFNRLFRWLAFSDFPAQGFDFMLISRRMALLIGQAAERNSYIFGQVMWLGFEKQVLYYERAERPSGRSRWTLFKKVKYFIDAFTAFSYLPIRAASVVGFVLAFAGFLYAAVVLVLRLTHAIPVPGFSALIVVVLLIGGVQLIVTGLIGEYVWRVLEETRRRPPFVVAATLNLPEAERAPAGAAAS